VPAAIVGLFAPRLIENRQPAVVLRGVGAARASRWTTKERERQIQSGAIETCTLRERRRAR